MSDELKPTLSFNFDNKNHSVSDIGSILTNDIIDDGQYCDNTVIDLRDCVIALQARITDLEQELAEKDAFCREFIWGENNPQEYKSELSKLRDKLSESRKANLRQRVGDILSGENCRDHEYIHLCCVRLGVSGPVGYDNLFDSDDRFDIDKFINWLIEQGVEGDNR